MQKEKFGMLSDKTPIDKFTLTNSNQVEVQILTYGGILHSITTVDRTGRPAEITMGYDRLEQYVARNPFFGALVGRYANRIAGGTFAIDEQPCTLTCNKGACHLHGGIKGFDKAVWHARDATTANGAALRLSYRSVDGEQGYPGNLDVAVTYTLDDLDRLHIDYRAQTDRPTVLNLTNHTYFNLTGDADTDILGHELMIAADRFTCIDEDVLPTGELAATAGTPLDFRTPAPIGRRIDDTHDQIQKGGGYDHNWVLNTSGDLEQIAARVVEPVSGRVLEVYTTQPGVQFYTGNNLDGSLIGKGGVPCRHRHAFCLETQHFPDSPNQPAFPSTVLRPEEVYQQKTIYRFAVESGRPKM